ncbi:MAG TPA: pitrilysin family protein [Syntrophorhabdales bacterium]|nr:pitrilysin family protein [Syntrophorhabdales bacterium]
MTTKRALLAALALLPIFLFVLVSSLPAETKESVSETVLSSGLKVLLLENHKAHVVTFQVWYRVGSRNEEYGKTGLSHLLEHMMFKGTEKIGPGELSRIIQENGGQHNAFTSADSTTYFQNFSADRINVSLELESDRMQHLMLREQDFRTERSVVMEERRLRTDDSPKAILWEQLEATAFQSQPYHWPVIGWMQDIARLTLDDLKSYYQRYYNPANAVLVVVGDFRKDELLSRIERFFGTIPKGARPEEQVSLEEPQQGGRRTIVKKEARLASLVMGYHVPNLREQQRQGSQQDSYALEVVEALLGSGESSRLQTSLVRSKKLALGVGVNHPLLSKDPSLFSISADVLPDKDVADVEKAIDEEIERLQREPVSERELQKAKNKMEAGFVFHQDSLFSQAMELAQYEMVLSWRNIDEYLPGIRKVSAEDVQRVAKRYLVPDNRTVAVLVPLPPKGSAPRLPDPSTREQGVK